MSYEPTAVPRNYELSRVDDPVQWLTKLQKTIDDLHKAVNQFERVALGSDCPSSMSIVGTYFCQQIGCFFRCENYQDLLEHSSRGLHFRFIMDRFDDTDLERISECNNTVGAVPASRNAGSGKQDTQMLDPTEASTQLPSMPVRKRVVSSAHHDVVSSVQGMLNVLNLTFATALTEKALKRVPLQTNPLGMNLVYPTLTNQRKIGKASSQTKIQSSNAQFAPRVLLEPPHLANMRGLTETRDPLNATNAIEGSHG
jgi:hypothetical protein